MGHTDLFEFEDYRNAITSAVKHNKELGIDITFQKLAEQSDIPKSYMSKVLNGGAHFSADQLYVICRELKLHIKYTEFFMLLLEYQRSEIKERKTLLFEKIKIIRNNNLQTENHIKLKPVQDNMFELLEYYLEPRVQILHIALTLPEFARDTRQLAQRLKFPPELIRAALDILIRNNLITLKGHQAEVLQDSLHLSDNSPLFNAWRTQLRQLSMARFSDLPRESGKSFSAVFTCNEEAKLEIHKKFLHFISQAKILSDNTPREKLCQINFDLHDWF